MNFKTGLVLISATQAMASVQPLTPTREGTLHYVISENSATRTDDSRTVNNHYQEVCKGEVKIPVFDMEQSHSGTSIKPQQVKCKVDTDDGPMEVVMGSYIALMNWTALGDKTPSLNKILDVSFGLSQDKANSPKFVSYNFFTTHTRDLTQKWIGLQTQSELIKTRVGNTEAKDSFSVRVEFEDDELPAENKSAN